jgi:PAS domain S-box-containing protein
MRFHIQNSESETRRFMKKAKILVVEDEGIIAEDLKRNLINMGYEVPSVVSSGEEAIKKAIAFSPDIVLMDIVLQGAIDGIEAAGKISSCCNIPVIYLTAYGDKKTLERAKITEPFGYIIKPFEERELHSIIEISLYKHSMERKLQEREEWLSTTLRSIDSAVITTDTKGCVKSMNPVAEALTGYMQEQAEGKNIEEVFRIVSEDTDEELENPVQRVLREGIIVGFAEHTVLIDRDGNKIPIDESGSPIRDKDGNPMGSVLTFRNITNRRQTEKALRKAAQEWRDTFDAISDFVSVIDMNFRFSRVNRALADFMDMKPEDMIGKHCYNLFCGTEPQNNCPHIKAMKLKKPVTEEMNYPNIGHPQMVTVSPIFDENGEMVSSVHFARDITEIKQAQEKMKSSATGG